MVVSFTTADAFWDSIQGFTATHCSGVENAVQHRVKGAR